MAQIGPRSPCYGPLNGRSRSRSTQTRSLSCVPALGRRALRLQAVNQGPEAGAEPGASSSSNRGGQAGTSSSNEQHPRLSWRQSRSKRPNSSNSSSSSGIPASPWDTPQPQQRQQTGSKPDTMPAGATGPQTPADNAAPQQSQEDTSNKSSNAATAEEDAAAARRSAAAEAAARAAASPNDPTAQRMAAAAAQASAAADAAAAANRTGRDPKFAEIAAYAARVAVTARDAEQAEVAAAVAKDAAAGREVDEELLELLQEPLQPSMDHFGIGGAEISALIDAAAEGRLTVDDPQAAVNADVAKLIPLMTDWRGLQTLWDTGYKHMDHANLVAIAQHLPQVVTLDCLGCRERSELVLWTQALLDSTKQFVPDMSPSEVSALAWAMGRLGHEDRGLCTQMQRETEATLDMFTPQQLSSLLWGMAKTGHRPPTSWLIKALDGALQGAQGDGQAMVEVAKMLYSCALVEFVPTRKWLNSFYAASRQFLPSFTARQLSNTLAAVGEAAAEMGAPPRAWLQECLAALGPVMQSLDGDAVADVGEAMAQLLMAPGADGSNSSSSSSTWSSRRGSGGGRHGFSQRSGGRGSMSSRTGSLSTGVDAAAAAAALRSWYAAAEKLMGNQGMEPGDVLRCMVALTNIADAAAAGMQAPRAVLRAAAVPKQWLLAAAGRLQQTRTAFSAEGLLNALRALEVLTQLQPASAVAGSSDMRRSARSDSGRERMGVLQAALCDLAAVARWEMESLKDGAQLVDLVCVLARLQVALDPDWLLHHEELVAAALQADSRRSRDTRGASGKNSTRGDNDDRSDDGRRDDDSDRGIGPPEREALLEAYEALGHRVTRPALRVR